MKKEKILYGILCFFSGLLIGLFANKLNTVLGVGLFILGVFLSAFSIMKLNK